MDQRKRTKRITEQSQRKRVLRNRQCCAIWSYDAVIVKTILLLCVINLLEDQRKGRPAVVSGSSFPGTIKNQATNSAANNNDWWQTSTSTNGSNDPAASKTNNEEDDGNKSDEESDSSSSEWEWDDEEEDNKGGGFSASTEESDLEDNDASDRAPASSKSSVEATTTSSQETNEEFKESSTNSFVKRSNNRPLPSAPSRKKAGAIKEKSTSSKSSSEITGLPNKPLQTLEKLQQMLDETDYLTSSSSAREAAASIIAEDLSSDEGEADDDEVDDGYDSSKLAEIQEQVQSPTPLWTSKDRSKYKRQIRQQRQRTQPKQYPSPPGGERQSARPPPSRRQPPQPSYVPPPNPYYRQQEYYQQQARIQQQQQQARLQQHQQHQQGNNFPKSTLTPKSPRSPYDGSATSDVEDPDDETDLDDGLGYTLPNLPVYLSDAEDSDYDGVISSSSTNEAEVAAAAAASSSAGIDSSSSSSQHQHNPLPQPPGTPLQQGQHQQTTQANELMLYPSFPHQTPPQGWYHPQQQQQQQQQVPSSSYYVPNNMVQPPPPAYYYPIPPPQGAQSQPQQQQQQQQQPQYPGHPQYGPYNYGTGNWYPSTPYQHHYGPRPYVPRIDTTTSNNNIKNKKNSRITTQSSPVQPAAPTITGTTVAQYPLPLNGLEVVERNAGQHAPSTRLSFRSVLKLSLCTLCSTLLCYAAVSPRNLSMLEYNMKFYENLRIAALTVAAPIFLILIVVDMAETNINNMIGGFANAFTFGYLGCFASQVVAATIIRLGVFLFWEPNVFDLAPIVPLPIIPWVLREHKYRPKRITLFIQDFITSCVVCPVLEEFFKLLVLQRSVTLSKNFKWVTRRSKSNNKKKKRVADPVLLAHPDDKEVTNVNHYISNMLAVSMGLKLADSIRRVCMYTKEGQDADRAFFALFRGIFPIHELCGTVTALSLARRDVLGQPMPMWKLLLPSAIIHGMANFRGMKPIFKWNSATPWSEMQLSPNFMTENTTLAQLAGKAFPKVMWLIILCRVAGYCVKNYYMINRQAVKRTTTFAGKHSAFSAELAAAEKLKASKKKKD